MKYEIKQLNDTNAVVISDEEIKDGFVKHIEYGICKVLSIKTAFIECEVSSKIKMLHPIHCKKIIATISPFKLEGLPMIELPNQEDDVERLAELKYPISKGGSMWMPTVYDCNKANKQEGFIEGYKTAQKKYSEEDMRDTCYRMWYQSDMFHNSENFEDWYKEHIQSLQKKQFPIAVELTEDLKVIKWHY